MHAFRHSVAGVVGRHKGLHRRTIPEGCKHIVVGHGVGRGDNWVMMHMRDESGRPIKVENFVGSVVPKGESALCVIGSADKEENIPVLEGKVTVSSGTERVRGA